MGQVVKPFYRILEIFTQFILLNLLWVLFSLPLITFFASTSAMFGVTRNWVIKDIDYHIFKPFVQMFKENLKQGILLQIIWTVTTAILVVDLIIVLNSDFIGREIVLGLIMLGVMLFVMMTVYLFPVMTHYQLSIRHILKNTLFLSIGSLGSTFLSILSVCILAVITYFFPIVLLVFGSILAFVVFQISYRSFKKIRI